MSCLCPPCARAGTCIVTIVTTAGLASWPQLVAALGEGLGGGNAAAVDGALDTLYKVGGRVKRPSSPLY